MKEKSTFVLTVFLTASSLLGFFSCENNPTESKVKVPEVVTCEVTAITDTSAKSGGIIISDGGTPVTMRGVCWSTNQTPTVSDKKTNDGTGACSYASAVTGLIPDTTYNLRAYATNGNGTGYGDILSFMTLVANADGVVTDIDGNTYSTVKIGDQWWMAENLKVTRYRNGTEIPKVLDNTSWSNLTTGAYCDYDNNPNNSEIYGRLYNWYAVKDVHNIAPDGWHIPSDDEWEMLVSYLGGDRNAGGKLKETDTTYWKSPNTGADNTSSFSALPGGLRQENGYFSSMGYTAYFWVLKNGIHPIGYYVGFSSAEVYIVNPNHPDTYLYDGYSIRCIKD